MTSGQTDYRARLYDTYFTNQAGSENTELALPALRRNIVDRLPDDRSAQILDIGCGRGELLLILQRRGYASAQGIDVSPEQVEVARARGVEVTQGDLVPFLAERPGGFDAICAIDVFEHFDKPDVLSVLDAVVAALRPGGMLLAQVPNGESPFVGRYLFGDFTHGTAFTKRSVSQVAGTVGFTEVEVFATDPVPHGLPSALRLAAWKLVSGALKVALFAETGVLRGHLVTQNLVFRARTTPDVTQTPPGPDA